MKPMYNKFTFFRVVMKYSLSSLLRSPGDDVHIKKAFTPLVQKGTHAASCALRLISFRRER